jgi:hypothetical protein
VYMCMCVLGHFVVFSFSWHHGSSNSNPPFCVPLALLRVLLALMAFPNRCIRCAYGIFSREITIHTVICSADIWFWPTLQLADHTVTVLFTHYLSHFARTIVLGPLLLALALDQAFVPLLFVMPVLCRIMP